MKNHEPANHDVFLSYFTSDRQRLYRFIYSLAPCEADAEDIFQQTSIVLWKKFDDFDQEREFYPWACRVAFHCTLNFKRSAKRRRLILNDELIGLIADERIKTSARDRFRYDMLKECISLLLPKDQELVSNVYQDGVSIQAVAQKTNRAIQTIYNRMSLIRKQLLDCVDRKTAAS